MAQVYVWGKYNLNVKYEENHSAQDLNKEISIIFGLVRAIPLAL